MTTRGMPTGQAAVTPDPVRPDPDPTILTTQQTLREITWLRELLTTRIDGMDKALVLLQATIDKSPSIAEMYAKHEQMFASIAEQFTQRDAMASQMAIAAKVAVDAAFAAQKEAASKQDDGNQKAIDKSEKSTGEIIKALGDKIDDLKGRVITMEGRAKGAGESWGVMMGLVGILLSIMAIVVTFTHK